MNWHPMFNGWVFFGLVLLIVFIGLGFAAAEGEAKAIDDKDCETWDSQNRGPHDEPDPNGCHEECVDGALWFKWGNRQWCYWDDA